jgi:hypothetical protein|tara:strand:- start:7667 stop:7909 length:243 start_codon:yes stop_codon:yes gene_type:complete
MVYSNKFYFQNNCVQIIPIAKSVHMIVLAVSGLSPAIHHVNAGNIRYEAEKAISLELHNAFVSSTIILVPHQKHKLIGMA